jgi:site-specific recombinase XerD
VPLSSTDLAELLVSWELALRAERKSPQTVKSYGDAVRGFLRWCQSTGTEAKLDRPTVSAWIAGILEDGAEAATGRARQLGMRRFSGWLLEEGETDRNELVSLKPVRLDQKLTDPLTDAQIRAMLAACTGVDKFRDRRDEALVRFMVETGTRAGEVVVMALADVDLPAGVALVRRGKGGKGRAVPFGPQTTQALDRYIRVRRLHRAAATPPLWLAARTGRGFAYAGLRTTLSMRAELAGIDGFHLHRLRHTAAHRWLAAGGSEGGLMAVAGWTRPDMLQRYTRARASERAAEEARKLNLGDL